MLHNNQSSDEYKSYHVIIGACDGNGQLLLGDLNAATDENLIKQHQIKTIITAATGLQHLQISSEITHIVFPLMDLKSENIEAYFELSYQTIDENLKRGSVLVHCGAGISRSATLVIAYYMKKYQALFSSAIKYVKKIRPNICPNLGFELQLKKYQQDLGINDGKSKVSQGASKIDTSHKKDKETKQMLFTFNLPNPKDPNHNTARTPVSNKKSFAKPTPITQRKNQHSTHKKNDLVPGELFIHGRQAGNLDLKNESLYNPQKYSGKNGLMGTWGPGMHKKEQGKQAF